MLGPLLHLTGEAFVPLVGGDPIGQRPVDFHVDALRALGAEVSYGPTGITAKAARLHGARITLPYPSVGATETVLLSAVIAEGKTVLRNAATEPEVVELALFLQRMGAQIELSPDRRIVIKGVPGSRPPPPGWPATASTPSPTWSRASSPAARCGCTAVRRTGSSPPSPPWPGWAPSSTSPRGTTASASAGCSRGGAHRHPPRLHDRLAAAPDGAVHAGQRDVGAARDGIREPPGVRARLQKMGCEIEVFAACLGGPACRFHDGNAMHSAVIRGVSKLRGAEVELPDVRAGSPRCSPRRWPTGRRRCTACTTSSAATTSRSTSSRPSGCGSPGLLNHP